MQQARIFTGKSTTLGQYGIDMAGVSGAYVHMARGIGRRSFVPLQAMGPCVLLFSLGSLGFAPERHTDQATLFVIACTD
jgi:SP family general alpha glucoside:H+ symporter-like MFS transporter